MSKIVGLEMKFDSKKEPVKVELELEITSDGKDMTTLQVDGQVVAFLHPSGHLSMTGKVI